jgi:hypothetical protein
LLIFLVKREDLNLRSPFYPIFCQGDHDASIGITDSFRNQRRPFPLDFVRSIGEQFMIRKSMAMAAAIAAALLSPFSVFAQGVTTGTGAASSPVGTPNAGSAGAGTSPVNGIPPGPGSGRGVNNSINDPSGIGNAAKVPPPVTSGTSLRK